MTTQAIAGVSSTSEAVIMTEYPSIASLGPARALGVVYEAVPSPMGLPKISYLFALATAPLGILMYFFLKAVGRKYVLTNREVQVWSARGRNKLKGIGLLDYDHAELIQDSGQVYYNAADIRFIGKNGQTLLSFPGVKDAEAFLNAIENARQARRQVQESLSRIESRS